jgi:hypothetical protein
MARHAHEQLMIDQIIVGMFRRGPVMTNEFEYIQYVDCIVRLFGINTVLRISVGARIGFDNSGDFFYLQPGWTCLADSTLLTTSTIVRVPMPCSLTTLFESAVINAVQGRPSQAPVGLQHYIDNLPLTDRLKSLKVLMRARYYRVAGCIAKRRVVVNLSDDNESYDLTLISSDGHRAIVDDIAEIVTGHEIDDAKIAKILQDSFKMLDVNHA